MTKNNYAFIDSQNVNLSIRELGWALDTKRFRKYLMEKYSITKAFLFIGYIATYKCLYDSLERHGYILIYKPTLKLPSGDVKGNVDAELVLHTMIEYPNFDKALIITGDGDFHCLVKYLINKDKLLKLLIPDKNGYSSLLREFVTHIHYMNRLRKKLEYKKKRGIKPSDETLGVPSHRDSICTIAIYPLFVKFFL